MLAVDAFVRLIPIIQDNIPKYVEKKVAINKGAQNTALERDKISPAYDIQLINLEG